MYMRGLGDIFGNGDVQLNEYLPADSTTTTSTAPSSGGSGSGNSADWSSVLKTAITTYGTVKAADTAANAQVAAQRVALQYPYGATMTPAGYVVPRSPVYTAQPSMFSGISPTAMIAGGVGLLALAFLATKG